MNAESKTVRRWNLCVQMSWLWVESWVSTSPPFSPVTGAPPGWSLLYSNPASWGSCSLYYLSLFPLSQPNPSMLHCSLRVSIIHFHQRVGAPNVDFALRNPYPCLDMSYFHQLFFENPIPTLPSMSCFLFVFLSTSLLLNSHTHTY